MRIKFILDSEEDFGTRSFAFTVDWTLPFLPREGEEISFSYLADVIDPHSFYEALTEECKNGWKSTAEQYMEKEGLGFSVAVERVLAEWLSDFYVLVTDITWCSPKSGAECEIHIENCA